MCLTVRRVIIPRTFIVVWAHSLSEFTIIGSWPCVIWLRWLQDWQISMLVIWSLLGSCFVVEGFVLWCGDLYLKLFLKSFNTDPSRSVTTKVWWEWREMAQEIKLPDEQTARQTFGEQVRKKLDDGTQSPILKPGSLDANTLFPSSPPPLPFFTSPFSSPLPFD